MIDLKPGMWIKCIKKDIEHPRPTHKPRVNRYYKVSSCELYLDFAICLKGFSDKNDQYSLDIFYIPSLYEIL